MARKLTPDEVIARSEKVHKGGYTYVKESITTTSAPMEIVCREHGPFKQTPSNHFAGKGCPACAGTLRLTTEEFIRRAIEIHGNKFDYSLVDYKSNNTPVRIVCPQHGEFAQTPAAHMSGKGCAKCGGRTRLTFDEFVSRAKKVHGDRYDYSNVSYKNNSTKVEVLCREHGSFQITPANLFAGKGCPVCAGNLPMTTEEFIVKAKLLHGDKYDYSKVVYRKSYEKVTIVCPTHGEFSQKPNNHLTGHGCRMCANEMGLLRMTQEEFLLKAEVAHGGTYTYENAIYKLSDVPVTINCRTHGEFLQTPEKHLAGQGCPSCAHSGPSKGQKEIEEFLNQYAIVVVEVPEPGAGTRFDMVLPEYGIAVEYHGLIWHSSRFLEDPRKDYKKHKRAEDLGIRVIHIYEDEWLKKPDVVKRVLLSAIGKLPKIYARKTSVVRLTQVEANAFYERNHLQGGRANKINLGLTHEGELVAAMSFDMLRSVRTNRDRSHWELTRYAATHTVVGGPSKLFSAFKLAEVAERVTSYSDNRVFDGGMYAKLGFNMVHETQPDYAYTTGRIEFGRQHKSAFQKSKLAKMFPNSYAEADTEKAICKANGLYQIYDCGKRRWDTFLNPSHQNETEPSEFG